MIAHEIHSPYADRIMMNNIHQTIAKAIEMKIDVDAFCILTNKFPTALSSSKALSLLKPVYCSAERSLTEVGKQYPKMFSVAYCPPVMLGGVCTVPSDFLNGIKVISLVFVDGHSLMHQPVLNISDTFVISKTYRYL